MIFLVNSDELLKNSDETLNSSDEIKNLTVKIYNFEECFNSSGKILANSDELSKNF